MYMVGGEIIMKLSLELQLTQTSDQMIPCVDRILDKYHYQPTKIIPILQAVQHEYSHLPEDVLDYIADAIDIPSAKLFGVATSYSRFAMEPKGKYIVRLCDGTACRVKKSAPIIEALHGKLGLSEKKKTTDNMLFTVETVPCLDICGLAPVMLINDEVYGQVTPKSAVTIAEQLLEKEQQKHTWAFTPHVVGE